VTIADPMVAASQHLKPYQSKPSTSQKSTKSNKRANPTSIYQNMGTLVDINYYKNKLYALERKDNTKWTKPALENTRNADIDGIGRTSGKRTGKELTR